MGKRSFALWSREARTDLIQIWEYYERIAGRQTAENIIRTIEDAIDLLEEYPLGGRAREEVRENLRSTAAHPHVVFYRISHTVVQIVRILDTRRDIESVLDEADNF